MKNLVKSAVVMGAVAGAKRVLEAMKAIDAETALGYAGLMRRPTASSRFASGAALTVFGAAIGAGAVWFATRGGGAKLREQLSRFRSSEDVHDEEIGKRRRRENDKNVAHGVS